MERVRRWAIIGAGNGGQAFAAYFSLMGIDVTIYDVFQNTVDRLNEIGGITITGNCPKTGFGKIKFASTDIGQVIKDSQVIWVTLPSIFHKNIAEKLAPCLCDGQTIIINPVAALGTIEFQKALADKGCSADITLAATCTLLFACRMNEIGSVTIYGMKDWLSVAAVPATRNRQVKALIHEFLPQFCFVKDVIAVYLDNANFIVHPGPTMLYSGLIEKEVPFEYYIDMFPSQFTLIERLDAERMEICKAYGEDECVPLVDLFKKFYGGAKGNTLQDMITTADSYKGIKGPTSLKVRYLYEDVPYALKGIQTLARMAEVKTPVMDAVIGLAYALEGDILDEGRTAKTVGIEGMSVKDILKMCRG